MKIAMIDEELIRLRLKPPSRCGLVSRAPSVAPRGRVRMKGVQKRNVCEAWVKKEAAATSASAPAKNRAPPAKPSPESSARKSPSAVPSVLENRIVVQ